MNDAVVLRDYALANGIDATPRDLALWASGQGGAVGVLGAQALAQTAPVGAKPAWLLALRLESWSRSGSLSRSGSCSWSRARSRSRHHL